jgi:hypothetical protein
MGVFRPDSFDQAVPGAAAPTALPPHLVGAFDGYAFDSDQIAVRLNAFAIRRRYRFSAQAALFVASAGNVFRSTSQSLANSACSSAETALVKTS